MTKIDMQAQAIEDDGYPTRPTLARKLRNILVHTSRGLLGLGIFLLMSLAGLGLQVSRLGKLGKQPPLQPEAFHPQRILIIRLDLIGDLVLSMVVVRVLKRTYPEAEIDLVAVPASASVVKGDPDLTRIIGYDPNLWRRPQALFRKKNWLELNRLLDTLHERHYDLAISVFGRWAGTLAVLSKARRLVGFGSESFPGFMTDNVPGKHWRSGDHKHEVDYCLELAQAAGATVRPDDRYPHLFLPEQAMHEVEQLLKAQGVESTKPLIACHVSANNGQSKRWPVPYWATLMDRLIRDENAYVVIIGAPNDQPLIEKITRRMRTQPINLAGKTSLIQLAALLKRSDLLISGDSGPMHIAGAVGTPLIAMHGPTDPALSGPVSREATVLKSDIWCSPCYKAKNTADCRFFTTQCMKDILPIQVFNVAREKLRKHGYEAHNNEDQDEKKASSL